MAKEPGKIRDVLRQLFPQPKSDTRTKAYEELEKQRKGKRRKNPDDPTIVGTVRG